jgi:hypothetical protein
MTTPTIPQHLVDRFRQANPVSEPVRDQSTLNSTAIVDHAIDRVDETFQAHYEPYVYPSQTSAVMFMNAEALLISNRLSPERRAELEKQPRWFTLLVGGSVHGDISLRDQLLRAIAHDARLDAPQYWNLVAYESLGYRLVLDLDSLCMLSKAQIFTLTRVARQMLREYYTEFETSPIPVFTSVVGPRPKKGKMATSVHIICHVQVTYVQAIQLIEAYRLRIQRETSLPITEIDVDAAIYKHQEKSVSIRAIYSRKRENCPACKSVEEERLVCEFCKGLGQMSLKDFYRPYQMLGQSDELSAEEFQRFHSCFEDVFRHHAPWIYTDAEKRTDYKIPPFDPDVKELEHSDTERRSNPVQTKAAPVPCCHPSYQLLQEDINRIQWKGQCPWKDVTVKSVSVNENTAFVQVSGLGNTWCSHVDRSHGSNRIYFVVDRKTGSLRQHCYSKKEPCGKVVSYHSFPILPVTCEKLFGPAILASSSTGKPSSPKHAGSKRSAPVSGQPMSLQTLVRPSPLEMAKKLDDMLRKAAEDPSTTKKKGRSSSRGGSRAKRAPA